MQILHDQISAQAAWIEKKRSNVAFGPKDVDQCANFLADKRNEIEASALVRHHQAMKKVSNC
jgi:hypothetical protein